MNYTSYLRLMMLALRPANCKCDHCSLQKFRSDYKKLSCRKDNNSLPLKYITGFLVLLRDI